MFKKFILLFLFFYLPNQYSTGEGSIKIFIITNNFHTGIVIPINELSKNEINILRQIEDINYVDFGWGDEDFYQNPEFVWYDALKAILIPTSSVVRVELIREPISLYINRFPFSYELNIEKSDFIEICKFINETFYFDSNNSAEIKSQRLNGDIRYYSSLRKYHLYYTCNTWVANALIKGGVFIPRNTIVTADDLKTELSFLKKK